MCGTFAFLVFPLYFWVDLRDFCMIWVCFGLIELASGLGAYGLAFSLVLYILGLCLWVCEFGVDVYLVFGLCMICWVFVCLVFCLCSVIWFTCLWIAVLVFFVVVVEMVAC